MNSPRIETPVGQVRSLAIAMELAHALSEELGCALHELSDARSDRQAIERAVDDVRVLLGADAPDDDRALTQVVRDAIAEARRDPEIPVTANEKKLSASLAGLAGNRWGRLVRLSTELDSLAKDSRVGPETSKILERLAAEAVKEETK